MENRLHLGRTGMELSLFELQHAVICFSEAFQRHIASQLVRITGDSNFSAQDCILLHGIRLGERPKSIPDLQHFTNRSDLANIQYSVRKLMKAGLVEKAANGAKRGTTYQLTKRGIEVTDEYVEARRHITELLPHEAEAFAAETKVACRLLMLLTGLYDQVSRTETIR
jgi:predicted MarR family transcription regulator